MGGSHACKASTRIMGRGGEITKENSQKSSGGCFCISLGLGIYMIVEGAINYNNVFCDVPFLNDGFGVARCLFWMGIAWVITASIQLLVLCCCHPEPNEDGSPGKPPAIAAIPLCCVVCFSLGWYIFYAVTTFQHKWDNSQGCPNEVHAFSWMMFVISWSIIGCVCVCCVPIMIFCGGMAMLAGGQNADGNASQMGAAQC